MKHLILLRHAKSSWANPEQDDFDRPLNKRGKRGARALGKWLRATGIAPQTILCSSARRARETWEGLELSGAPFFNEDLYHANADQILEKIRSSKADGKWMMVIGHNPAIGTLAKNLLVTPPEHPRFGDFPTGALLVADFDVKSFAKIVPASGTARHFLTPHDLVEHQV